ncbi:Endonuclease/exonuclease/phosphatase [Fimicolochytrium jonesii]|uniref:Endonuclease/exonuclease/phosphatase n=1 Tax=Fimicolochytrium jonesii TaxID=1396493 RepID=UPI0022FEC24E|nr:Endonuclease/exonuclease/phosphatase [Fimicolochytrium jonesii]KAI8825272.1 Endonuclease/exonuclease/phosphatase [Fimicolochytrium jonesii]
MLRGRCCFTRFRRTAQTPPHCDVVRLSHRQTDRQTDSTTPQQQRHHHCYYRRASTEPFLAKNRLTSRSSTPLHRPNPTQLNSSHHLTISQPLRTTTMPTARILTLNFFLRPPGISEPSSKGDWKGERATLFADLEFANYDIISFQETFGALSDRRKKLIAAAKEKGFIYHAAGKVPSVATLRIDAGLLVLSRFPVTVTEEWTFQRGTEIGDWFAAKGVLYSKIQLQAASESTKEKTLHLFSTHFQSTDSPKALILRHKQYHQSKAFIDSTLAKHAPKFNSDTDTVLFVGDMNVDARASGDDGVGHGREYLTMKEIYEGGSLGDGAKGEEKPANAASAPKYEIGDICYETMGEHPITTSRLRVGPNHEAPDRKCIDFILQFRPLSATAAPTDDTTTTTTTPPAVKFDRVRIEKFVIDNQPFSFLSDHFGVAADLTW